MQAMKTYYAVGATLRYYKAGKRKGWPDPPHVFFANLSPTPDGFAHFERIYGPISDPTDLSHLRRREQIKRLTDLEAWSKWGNVIVSSRPKLWKDALVQARIRQDILREAWAGDEKALSQMGIGRLSGRTYGEFLIRPVITPVGVDLYAGDMWSFIRIAFLRDLFLKRPRICANQAYGCPSPYFLESRKGQTFCCHKCAVQMNVRRFRERENKKRK
jgi:hypothetical protein